MRRDDAGFTLLEVLVAFIIAALALGVMFHGTLGGLAATQAAGRYEEALSRAQSRLAALGRGPLRPGDRQGDDGNGFHWHERIRLMETATVPASNSRQVPALFAVSVAVSWGEGGRRQVQLNSERIGLVPRPTP
jgi:general secretion pathway protein I